MAFTDDQLRERMEPEVAGLPLVLAPEISIAISMKRMADALTYQPTGGENLYDMLNDILNAVRHNTVPHAR